MNMEHGLLTGAFVLSVALTLTAYYVGLLPDWLVHSMPAIAP